MLEVGHPRDTIVDVTTIGIEVAEAGNLLPSLLLSSDSAIHCGKSLFAFSPEHAADKRVTTQKSLVVS